MQDFPPRQTAAAVSDHSLLQHARPAVVMLLLFTVLTGLVYPLAMTAIAQIALPWRANGSLVVAGGKVVGSALIGQNFQGDRYFHGRPSATTGPDPNDASKSVAAPYNAANSTGSNYGPLSKDLRDRMEGDAAKLKAETGATLLPADSVTASASGLDPDISPAFAALQVPRIAKARGLNQDTVRALLAGQTEWPIAGFLGEPEVNVLRINLALDALPPS
jgi:potassium-transporting ATPase KdpC subunit